MCIRDSPSGHPDPHSSIIASVVESQSTASSAATITSTVSADTSDISPPGFLARQPPIGIETAAATNPTIKPIRDATDILETRSLHSLKARQIRSLAFKVIGTGTDCHAITNQRPGY